MVYESNYRPARTVYDDELMHYGVPGMKWGRRKAPTTSYGTARAQYKAAKKAYSKSYNKAYNRSIASLSPIKKHRQANDARWEDAFNKAAELRSAKAAYKQAKQERKQAIGAAKSAYKSAKKDYSKSFNKAYNRNLAGLSPIKKHRQANDARWEDAYNKAVAMNEAKANYKKTKADYRRG